MRVFFSFFFPVYDVLTGKVHSVLSGHRACVRDVSWHPHRQELISTSVSSILICM
jgi:WD repeat-containing protein 23